MSYFDNVFLNCPFDGEYQPLFRAMVFAVHDCGYVARCALEVDDASTVRIDKIAEIIRECRLGIHDISRVELDSNANLPRFNMPLELGIFLGAKRFGIGKQKSKRCLVLDREKYRYQQFCSDIAGQDIRAHSGDASAVIRVIRDWLRNVSHGSGVVFPSGKRMVGRFETFRTDLPQLCDTLLLDPEDLIFNDYTTLVAQWLRVNSW